MELRHLRDFVAATEDMSFRRPPPHLESAVRQLFNRVLSRSESPPQGTKEQS
jgi:hypothetical protein